MSDELIPLLSPPIEFYGSEASSTAQKRTYRLRDLMPAGMTLNPGGASPLPDEVRVGAAMTFDQSNEPYPAAVRGRFSWGVDYRGQYVADSNFGPVEELCWPGFIANLGHITFTPGTTENWQDREFTTPRIIRPDDLIVVAPEIAGADSRFFQCAFALGIVSAIGRPQVIPGTVFRSAMSFDRPPVTSQRFCLRSVIPAIGSGGMKGKLRLTSWTSGMSQVHVSVGVRDGSTANMKAAPVPVTMGANATISLPPYRSEDTDEFTLTTHQGDELLVNISFLAGANAWAGAVRRDRVSYYVVDGPDSYASAAMQGSVVMQSGATEGRTHCVDWVKVW